MKQASVIICSYNHLKYLKISLPAILAQSIGIDNYEVIVVNDCSTDGTKDYLKGIGSFIGPFEIIHNEINMGLSKSRNIGIRASKSEILIFLDDDNVAENSLVKNYIEAHKVHDNAIIQGNQIFPEWILRNNFAKYWSQSVVPGNTRIDFNNIPVKNIGPGNISIMKSKLMSVGGFNEEFRFWGLEDGEIAYRLCKIENMRIVYFKEAITTHIDESFTLDVYLRKFHSQALSGVPILKRVLPDYIQYTMYRFLEPLSKNDRIGMMVVKTLLNIAFISGFPAILTKILLILEYNRWIIPPNLLYRIALSFAYKRGVWARKHNIKQDRWF
jgi:glycosyltransferase involved in cell wall biosynthesis